MKVLLIKMSSLGDLIHTFPAITDAHLHRQAKIDWVVDETFQDVPRLHPHVNQVFPVSLRALKKNPFHVTLWKQVLETLSTLRASSYDVIIDAQGLIKSALVSSLAGGKLRCGFDQKSIREKTASFFYHRHFAVSWEASAIQRNRILFSKALGYEMPLTAPDSCLISSISSRQKRILFLHGTTRDNKKWPKESWKALAELLLERTDLSIHIPWSNPREHEDALWISSTLSSPRVHCLESMPLGEILSRIPSYCGVVSTDSGLGHAAAAYGVPTVMVWGSSSAQHSSLETQYNVQSELPCSPCFKRSCYHPQAVSKAAPPCLTHLSPLRVYQALEGICLTKEADVSLPIKLTGKGKKKEGLLEEISS